VKTLEKVTRAEWDEISNTFGVSHVVIWRASSAQELRRHQGNPVGMRRGDDGMYEVQINYDSMRRRPQSIHRDQFTLYCLYCALAKISLGHLDSERDKQPRAVRIGNREPRGSKPRVAELTRAASDWAVARIRREEQGNPVVRPHDEVTMLAAA
jgi:hypothetical protein